jgi:hypothetical protein
MPQQSGEEIESEKEANFISLDIVLMLAGSRGEQTSVC